MQYLKIAILGALAWIAAVFLQPFGRTPIVLIAVLTLVGLDLGLRKGTLDNMPDNERQLWHTLKSLDSSLIWQDVGYWYMAIFEIVCMATVIVGIGYALFLFLLSLL